MHSVESVPGGFYYSQNHWLACKSGFYEGHYDVGLDITRRILAHATPTPSGIFVDDAELPRGHHRVTVQIADNLGRVGTQSAEFNVV
jgi:hypothetical protein